MYQTVENSVVLFYYKILINIVVGLIEIFNCKSKCYEFFRNYLQNNMKIYTSLN
jgi:hypothetical protein